MCKFINLTPHALNVQLGDTMIEIPASGAVARCAVNAVDGSAVYGIPTVTNTYGEVQGLPALADMEHGAVYLVSALVLGRLGAEYAGRVFAPDTGATAIRENGQIKAVTQLVGVSA